MNFKSGEIINTLELHLSKNILYSCVPIIVTNLFVGAINVACPT